MGTNSRRLAELERICSEPFQERIIDLNGLDEFSRRLVVEANKQNYLVYSLNGISPRVIVLGTTHRHYQQKEEIYQTQRIGEILNLFFNNKDALLLEGFGGPTEIELSQDMGDSFLIGIRNKLDGRLRRVILNDETKSWAEALVALQNLQNTEEKYGKESAEYEPAAQSYLSALETRDKNFCRHLITGIVPLVRGTSATYQPLHEHGRLWQVLGLMHLHAGTIEKILREEKVSFVMFLPREGYVLNPGEN